METSSNKSLAILEDLDKVVTKIGKTKSRISYHTKKVKELRAQFHKKLSKMNNADVKLYAEKIESLIKRV